VLGVTSGSGWRPADTGAYGCAKRAVANLTWQLGRHAPDGVVVNAISPIAMTRMVAAAMERHRSANPPKASAAASGGGLVLGTRMPTAEELGAVGAHLVGDGFSACRGQVIFLAGSELAVVDEPRLLEVVGTEGAASLAHLLEAVTPAALVPAEAKQASKGGSNLRFAAAYGGGDQGELPAPAVRSCALVVDDPRLRADIAAALGARGVTCRLVPTPGPVVGFDAAAAALASAMGSTDPVDAVVVAPTGPASPAAGDRGWEQVLSEHHGIVDGVFTDATWSRAVADEVGRTGRPLRLVSITDAATAGGRSRAQAVAHHARAARGATDDRVSAFAVGLESTDERDRGPLAELVAHLLCSPESPGLSGAELAVGRGTIGLRSHPRVGASIAFGGPGVPEWLDATLREVARP
jgi:hypothetical protein